MTKSLDLSTLIAYCGLIFWLSAQESLPVPEVFNFQDKALHFGAYSVMAVFSWRAFRHMKMNGLRLTIFSFAFCSIYGLSDEWHQSFVTGRTASIWDWITDSLGAGLTAAVLLRTTKNSASPV